jgi:signal transduction histidine kinase
VKIKFFGILSHDLRRPIASFVHFITLKKLDLLSAEEREAHEVRTTVYARNLLDTMDNMLLWSKSQMEQFSVERKPVSAEQLFVRLKKNFQEYKDIRLVFTDDEQIRVETDENILQTIMLNLTGNALNALESCSDGEIAWSARRNNGEVIFTICDNGPGAGAGQLTALYDDTAVGSAKNGLGLHIIRDLAQAIGLTISHNTARQQGTELVLVLPG